MSENTEPAIKVRAGMEVIGFMGARITLVQTKEDTGGALTLFDYVAPSHFAGPPPHWHAKTSETYFVISGAVRATLGDRTVDLGPGESVHVPAGVVHQFSNPHDEPARFLSYMTPGGFEDYFRELVKLAASSPEWPPKDRSALAELSLKFDQHPPPAAH